MRITAPIELSEEMAVPRIRHEKGVQQVQTSYLSREIRIKVMEPTQGLLGYIQCSSHDITHMVQGYLLAEGHIGALSDIQELTLTWTKDIVNADGVAPMLAIREGHLVNPYAACQQQPPTTTLSQKTADYVDVVASITLCPPAERTVYTYPPLTEGPSVPLADLLACGPLLDSISEAHHRTHGVHEGAIVHQGTVLAYVEDIGRHNVLDRLFAFIMEKNIPVQETVLVFSGRVPFSVVAKVRKMGFPIMLSRAVPTSLGIAYGTEQGITLVTGLRVNSCNIYSHPERIILP